VWLSSEVRSLTVADGRVTGAVVERDGEVLEVGARIAVSDVGPAATVRLAGEQHFPSGYLAAVRRGDRPSAMISVNFASSDPLVDAPGLLSFAATRRLCYVANFTATCPEMAPDGWHLYVGTAVPKPAVGAFDAEAETRLLMADLRDEIPGFGTARILSTVVTRDSWPPQRAVAGFDLPNTTPVANLWNVGDGAKEYGNGGTTACAETAKLVADQIVAQYPVGVTP
jgi:phytoene dehydrogenase-like protein